MGLLGGYAESDNPFDVARALCILVEKKSTTPSNIDAVAKHVFPISLAYALSFLEMVGILDANRQAVILHPSLSALVNALFRLDNIGALTAGNVQFVIEHANLRDWSNKLCFLKKKGF